MSCLIWLGCGLTVPGAGAAGCDGRVAHAGGDGAAAVGGNAGGAGRGGRGGPRGAAAGGGGVVAGCFALTRASSAWHGDGRLALLLGVLVVRHQRQQFVKIRDRTRIVALGAEQLGAREIGSALGLRALRDGAGKILDRMIDVALTAIDLAAPEKCVLGIRV